MNSTNQSHFKSPRNHNLINLLNRVKVQSPHHHHHNCNNNNKSVTTQSSGNRAILESKTFGKKPPQEFVISFCRYQQDETRGKFLTFSVSHRDSINRVRIVPISLRSHYVITEPCGNERLKQTSSLENIFFLEQSSSVWPVMYVKQLRLFSRYHSVTSYWSGGILD